MKILIDADGCPVVDLAVAAAQKFHLECLLLCDTAHVFEKQGARTLTFSKGPDSVDFALANLAQPGDVVVTQDYGLAAMCLARNAAVLNQNGLEYTADNIDALLQQRHMAKKIRNAGGRLKGPPKRKPQQNKDFCDKLEEILARQLARGENRLNKSKA